MTVSFIRTKKRAGIFLTCFLLISFYATKLLLYPSSSTVTEDQSSFEIDDRKNTITDRMDSGFFFKTLSPLVIGFCLGFIGSVPIAGPTSALVLKLGIQEKYWSGRAVAVGGALAESVYAGLAYWGFGSFLAGLNFLLPASKYETHRQLCEHGPY